jgi:SNF2 family DNA or RNA helicase
MTLQSGIHDNYLRNSVGDFLRGKMEEDSNLSIVSAYFTIYAYAALEGKLEQIERLRFLFGEPRFVRQLDPDRTDKKAFDIEDRELRLHKRAEQKAVAKACADWIERKADIRSIKKAGFLHGKLYHIQNPHDEHAILGSSNFTVRGLGLATSGNNIELNLEVDSRRDREDLVAWFDEIWNDASLVEDVKAEVLQYLAQLYQNHPPQFIYFKTLYHIFEQFLTDQRRSELLERESHLFDTQIWQTLFEFQKDGVKSAINKIQTHNGCIIADSVGLGKTYEALAIIKYFELHNDRVLVLCPKKLRENWTVYQAQNNSALNPFLKDRYSYTVLSHTDLSRESGLSGDIDLSTLNWGNYDLVVIDESHNFRNNTRGKRDEEGNRIRQSRYERLMEDILQAGVPTKVLLLSATPVNTDLKDLRNQIYFLTEGKDDAFAGSMGVDSLRETLAAAQRTFTEWAKKGEGQRSTRDLLENFSAAFFKLLDELTIARSRKHIQRYYASTIAELGGFPERRRPRSIYAETDSRGLFLSYDRLNDEISKYRLALFNPSFYILPQYAARYDTGAVRNFSQGQRENFLIGMMKVNFLKRLESSVHSFSITMERTIGKIETLEERIRRFQQFSAENPELSSDELRIEADEDEELLEALEVGKSLVFQLAHLDTERWLADLRVDKQQLNMLYTLSKDVTPERDAKLTELKKLIAAKVQSPPLDKLGKPNRKVLVFTAFADTASYLYRNLRAWARETLGLHIGLVTGGPGGNSTTLGRSEFNQILTNFSPRSKKRAALPQLPQDEEIDILIATDCISEGQNLQDCDYLVNYDIHWNPVRIVQRFGRIDRIGSVNQTVQLVNFWPTPDLNQYIRLKNRVEARMALVDIAATFEDNVLAPDEIEDLIEEDLRYRDRQLLRMKDEILEMEDFNESVALTDFSLDDFRMELSRYIEANRRLLHDAPMGLYAVVPTHPDWPMIRPGVVFCLKQEGPAAENAGINPLHPYYLVYILDDGEVRYTFAHPKQILEIYRLLCAEQTVPYEELCALFDQRTQDGANMAVYSQLLERAVQSIERTFQKRSASHLLSGRGAKLIPANEQASAASDFQLITWLVIE